MVTAMHAIGHDALHRWLARHCPFVQPCRRSGSPRFAPQAVPPSGSYALRRRDPVRVTEHEPCQHFWRPMSLIFGHGIGGLCHSRDGRSRLRDADTWQPLGQPHLLPARSRRWCCSHGGRPRPHPDAMTARDAALRPAAKEPRRLGRHAPRSTPSRARAARTAAHARACTSSTADRRPGSY